jgi:hypothetical protein
MPGSARRLLRNCERKGAALRNNVDRMRIIMSERIDAATLRFMLD